MKWKSQSTIRWIILGAVWKKLNEIQNINKHNFDENCDDLIIKRLNTIEHDISNINCDQILDLLKNIDKRMKSLEANNIKKTKTKNLSVTNSEK